MINYNSEIITEKEAEKVMNELGCSKAGTQIMLSKTKFRLVKLEKVRNSLATILKQEMLAAGGDVAVHEKTTRCLVETTDVLVMGTLKQYHLLIRKMMVQSPTEAKGLASTLSHLLFNKTS